MQGSNMTQGANDSRSVPVKFNASSPDGAYCLDLGADADHAVAVQLCELDAASGSDLMQKIRLNGNWLSSVKRLGWPAK